LKTATVLATDASAAAVVVAKRNIEKLGLSDRVTVEMGDLFEPLSRVVDARPFDLIVSNPPYIPTAQIDQLDRSVKDYEPRMALDGGLDGLAIHRRILTDAPQHLLPRGRVYLEIMFDQGPAALEMAKQYEAFEGATIIRDNAGKDRLVMLGKT